MQGPGLCLLWLRRPEWPSGGPGRLVIDLFVASPSSHKGPVNVDGDAELRLNVLPRLAYQTEQETAAAGRAGGAADLA